MPAFAGVDLAWKPGRDTGVCILRADGGGVCLERVGTMVATPTAFAQLLAAFGDTVYAAVDAPLVLSPERRAEALLARRYGRAKASAYHAGRDWLARNNMLAGPQLAEALAARGFAHAVPSVPNAHGRFMVEVFPHATHVALFGLAERLKYKRGTLTARAAVMTVYQAELARLLQRELPRVAADPRVQALLEHSTIPTTTRDLKRLEDQLDALTCAIAAHHVWRHGPAGLETFGNAEHGQIAVPLLLHRGLAPIANPES